MRTSLDCLPCFMRQALAGARLAAPGDVAVHRRVVLEFCEGLKDYDFRLPPPALAKLLYTRIRETTGCREDLFIEHKRAANIRALELLPDLREMVGRSPDPLETALHLSIIGNYIDAGIEIDFDWEAELDSVSKPLPPDILDLFRSRAKAGASVLILGDNAGEIALDTLLAERLVDAGCRVAYAVRSGPVLNDATLEDADYVGMSSLCEVVESGVTAPGTILSQCSDSFLGRMRESDVVLSKGQGNFESLWGEFPGVFCAFKVKCPVVAEMVGLPVGSSAFAHDG